MPPEAFLVLASLAAVALYLASCRIWPYAACRRCTGAGKLRSPSGRSWRTCKPCQGTGRRLRAGQRIVNAGNATRNRAR